MVKNNTTMIIILAVLAVLVITNPSRDKFDNWYEYNVEIPMRIQFNEQVNSSLSSDNNWLDMILKGTYDYLLRDSVEKNFETELLSLKSGVSVVNYMVFTVYIVPTNTQTLYVMGIMNNFFIYNIE